MRRSSLYLQSVKKIYRYILLFYIIIYYYAVKGMETETEHVRHYHNIRKFLDTVNSVNGKPDELENIAVTLIIQQPWWRYMIYFEIESAVPFCII